jgi:predicted DNA-binding protein (MmcQ/YjbR family)
MTSRYPPVALPDSPYARELQGFCLTFPGPFEDYPWGDIVYKVGAKLFAAIGGEPIALTVKATPEDADVLVQLPHISVARYIGRWGWVTVEVSDAATFEHAKELIEASYALVAPKRRTSRVQATGSK